MNTKSPELKKLFVCSICSDTFLGFGNNPWPVTKIAEDRCCDNCNGTKVIPARLALIYRNREEK
jgi:hypothetical protein